jgi:hypothetical protein
MTAIFTNLNYIFQLLYVEGLYHNAQLSSIAGLDELLAKTTQK